MTDPDPPKRRRGRPSIPGAPTSVERTRASRLRRAAATVELPATTIAAIDARRLPDETRSSAVTRLVLLTKAPEG